MARRTAIPFDRAEQGDCSGAKRALGAMRPGLARDYEAARVGEVCGVASFAGLRRRACKPAKKALAKGTRIEKREHKLPVKMARKIARDHLCENPRYYAKSKKR